MLSVMMILYNLKVVKLKRSRILQQFPVNPLLYMIRILLTLSLAIVRQTTFKILCKFCVVLLMQKHFVTGRALELESGTKTLEGKTNYINVDRMHLLETTFEEVGAAVASNWWLNAASVKRFCTFKISRSFGIIKP